MTGIFPSILITVSAALPAACKVIRRAAAGSAKSAASTVLGQRAIQDSTARLKQPGEDIVELAGAGKPGPAGMRECARLPGGTMNIEKRPGNGTVITIEVPL